MNYGLTKTSHTLFTVLLKRPTMQNDLNYCCSDFFYTVSTTPHTSVFIGREEWISSKTQPAYSGVLFAFVEMAPNAGPVGFC